MKLAHKPENRFRCRNCGATDMVRQDCFAEWSDVMQQWEIVDLYGRDMWCGRCDAENDIEETAA